MDIIMEVLFELILEGALEASSDRKVPLVVRIAAAIVLLGIYGGMIGFCLYLGIHDGNSILLLLAVIILAVTAAGAGAHYRRRRK